MPQSVALRREEDEPRVKGLAIMALVESMRQADPAAAGRVPERLRHYFDDRVLVSSWYPERDHLDLMRQLASWIQIPGKEIWPFLGRKNAELDLGGTYSAMVQRRNPRITLERFPRLWSLYRDHGDPRVSRVTIRDGRGEGVVELFDYPLAGDEIAGVVAGYLAEALRRACAEEVTSTVLSAREPMGWRVTWREPD